MQEKSALPTNNDNIDETIDFLIYLETLARNKKMILKVTISAFVLSIMLSLILPKKYAGIVRILPPQQDQSLATVMMGAMGGGALSSLAGNILGTGTLADQYASILQSERIKDSIIDRFKLMDEYSVDYRIDMYKLLDNIVTIKAGKKDGIITVTAISKDPKKAADIANAYIDELGKLNAEMSMSDAGRNRGFLEGRLAQAKSDLVRAEDALKVFQTNNKVISVTDQAKASIEGLALLKAQLAVQEAQLSALRSQFTDSAQEVQNVKATVVNLKAQINKLEGIGIGAIPAVGSVPNLGQEQIRLLREFKIQETIVELLTKQYELAKLTEAKNINTVQVIQRAQVPDKKVKPKRSLIVLALTFMAFVGAVFSCFAQEYFESISPDYRQRWKDLAVSLGFKKFWSRSI